MVDDLYRWLLDNGEIDGMPNEPGIDRSTKRRRYRPRPKTRSSRNNESVMPSPEQTELYGTAAVWVKSSEEIDIFSFPPKNKL
jgi:hypothetical protein